MLRFMRVPAAVVLLAMIVGLSGCLPVKPKGIRMKPDAPVVSFGYSHTGSSAYDIYSYEIRANEETGETEVYYSLHCGNEEYILKPTDELRDELEALIDRNALWTWDGFDETNSGVLDGEGFSLTITYGDESTVSASGSNGYPEGYGDAASDINELFRGYLKENGIEPEGGL